jgi:hypothetical protein
VRYVIHFDPPESMSHYLQESGRVGRNKLPADAIMREILVPVYVPAHALKPFPVYAPQLLMIRVGACNAVREWHFSSLLPYV